MRPPNPQPLVLKIIFFVMHYLLHIKIVHPILAETAIHPLSITDRILKRIQLQLRVGRLITTQVRWEMCTPVDISGVQGIRKECLNERVAVGMHSEIFLAWH